MDTFEAQLAAVLPVLDRYVKFKLNSSPDADDLLQDICLTAYLKYGQLEKKGSFKPWILSIARNRCTDYFRKRKISREVPLEEIPEAKLVYGRRGWTVTTPVEETLDHLTDRDREVLRLFYWKQLSLTEISDKLNIPVGSTKFIGSPQQYAYKENGVYVSARGSGVVKWGNAGFWSPAAKS